MSDVCAHIICLCGEQMNPPHAVLVKRVEDLRNLLERAIERLPFAAGSLAAEIRTTLEETS